VCRGYPVESYYSTCWVTGHWSTKAKVEGIMLKAAWLWGGDSSVVNDPLGGPGCTPLYAFCLHGASWMVTICFSPILWECSLNG